MISRLFSKREISVVASAVIFTTFSDSEMTLIVRNDNHLVIANTHASS